MCDVHAGGCRGGVNGSTIREAAVVGSHFVAAKMTSLVKSTLTGCGPVLASSVRSSALSVGEGWSSLGELRFPRPLPKLPSRRPDRRAAHRFA